jgi:hypothetical protein
MLVLYLLLGTKELWLDIVEKLYKLRKYHY